MKTRLSILMFLFPFVVSAQGIIMDSITIEVGENKSIEIISKDFHKLDKWGNIDSIYNVFTLDLKKMDDNFINEQKSNTMVYDYKSKYRMIKLNSESAVAGEVSIDENGNVVHFQKVEFLIGEDESMIVKSANLSGFYEINEMDMNDLIRKSDEHIFPEGRGKKNHVYAFLKVENDMIDTDQSEVRKDVRDILELGILFGVGTIRNVLTPDIEFQLMVGLSKKGSIKHQFGIANQWLFSFPVNEEGKTVVKKDGFIDGIYSLSYRNRNSGKKITMGMRAGMLVTSNSVNFEEGASRFGFFKGLGHGIMLEGGLYSDRALADFYPYARIYWAW